MTRSKTRPPIRKPVLDEEDILEFAAHNAVPAAFPVEQPSMGISVGNSTDRKTVKVGKAERHPLELMLKREIIVRLEDEAARKEKSIGQVVEKLVTKYLGKH
jgi:hypothetical protein